MLNAKVFAALLAAVALVASPGLALAGGGGAGLGGDNVFYTCYMIQQGMKPPQVLSVNDQFTNGHDVRLGKAKLLCTPADGVLVSGPELNPMPSPDHLTCYEVDDNSRSGALVELQDSFGTQTVRVNQPKYVCNGSNKTCLDNGCPILDSP